MRLRLSCVPTRLEQADDLEAAAVEVDALPDGRPRAEQALPRGLPDHRDAALEAHVVGGDEAPRGERHAAQLLHHRLDAAHVDHAARPRHSARA